MAKLHKCVTHSLSCNLPLVHNLQVVLPLAAWLRKREKKFMKQFWIFPQLSCKPAICDFRRSFISMLEISLRFYGDMDSPWHRRRNRQHERAFRKRFIDFRCFQENQLNKVLMLTRLIAARILQTKDATESLTYYGDVIASVLPISELRRHQEVNTFGFQY